MWEDKAAWEWGYMQPWTPSQCCELVVPSRKNPMHYNWTVKKDVGVGLTNVKSLADLETAWADSNRKVERIADFKEVVDVQ